MTPILWLLASCTSAQRDDTNVEQPVVASIVYDGALPDCALGFVEEVLCAGGGSVPGSAHTSAQVNLVPDWYWQRGEPGVVLLPAAEVGAAESPCSDDEEAALAVLAAERPTSVEFVTGTDAADGRWIDVLLYGEGSHAVRYRVPRCAMYTHFGDFTRLRYADSSDLDPAWTLREPPGTDDAARDAALYDALDVARVIESHRATISYAGTDRTYLYAVGTSIAEDTVRYRTCRVDGVGYAEGDRWKHEVWQVEYTFDLATGNAKLDQELVGNALCDRPIASGVW